MQWSEEYRPCPVCGSASYKEIGYRGGKYHRDRLGIQTMVVRCNDCTARYARPFLIPQGNPYETEIDYFEIHDPEVTAGFGDIILTDAEQRLGRPGRVLELGCGRGILLRTAKERGWNAYGVEMTKQFADIARQHVVVELASAEDCTLLNNKYDLILLPAILEHLYEPVKILDRIRHALVDDGLLYIDIPNEASLSFTIGNLYARPASINLSPTFSPYHVVGFSPQSIRKALDLADLSVKWMKTFNYINALPGGNLKRNIERFAMSVVQNIGARIGRGDGLVIWAGPKK